MQYEIEVNGRLRQVTVRQAGGTFAVIVDGKERAVDAARVDNCTLSLLIEDYGRRTSSHEVTLAPDPATGGLRVSVGSTAIAVAVNGRRRWGQKHDQAAPASSGPYRIVAPMPGKIVRVLLKKGELVQARQSVVVIEAMKMENELRAGSDGTLAEIHVRDGQLVEAGALLAVIHR